MSKVLEESLKTIAKGGGIFTFGTISSTLLTVVFAVLLARVLDVSTYGLYYLGLSITNVLVIMCTLGLPGSIPRYIPYYNNFGNKDIVKSTIRFSQVFILCVSLIFGINIYIFSDIISINIFHNNNLSLVLKYFAFLLPLLSLSNIMNAILRAFKAAKSKVAIFDIGIWVIRIIIFIPFILIGYSLFGAVLSYILALMFSIVLSIFILNKRLFSDQSKYKIVPVAHKLISFSWPITIGSIIHIFYTNFNVLIIGYYLNSTDVGLYMPNSTIASYVIFLATPFSLIFLPVVSELFGKGDLETIESVFKSASKWIFMIVLPILLSILLFPKEIITLLYGSRYSVIYIPLMILATGTSMTAFTGMTGAILVGSGLTKLNLLVEIITGVTNISLSLILIPLYGIIGIAVATSLAFFMAQIASLLFVKKTTKMHPYNKKYFRIILAGLIVLVIGYIAKAFISNYFYSITFLFFIIEVLFLFCLYILLIFFFKCFDKNDTFILNMITKKIPISSKLLKYFIDDEKK